MKATTIILNPGDHITIQAAAINPPTPPLSSLPIPFLSQWGPHADHAPGDCGPTCLTMAIHYLTDKQPTINQVSVAAGLRRGAKHSDFNQISKAARRFDLSVEHIQPISLTRIKDDIQAGYPVITLVNYPALSTKDDPNQDKYRGAHFVLVVGFLPQAIVFHDPDRLSGDSFGQFRQKSIKVFDTAMKTTNQTPGNTLSYHGMVFNA